jgi:hypothetical protein
VKLFTFLTNRATSVLELQGREHQELRRCSAERKEKTDHAKIIHTEQNF